MTHFSQKATWTVPNGDKMFAYAHTPVPAYAYLSAEQLPSAAVVQILLV